MPNLLIIGFFLTALLYASVGFGGGSTYAALLATSAVDYQTLPILSLSCNIIVVAGGAWRFGRLGYVDIRRVFPLLIGSIPAAFLGGLTPISEDAFFLFLGLGLCLTGVALLVKSHPWQTNSQPIAHFNTSLGVWVIGLGIGYFSGLVGIGGGIFLAPILYFIGWADAKNIAATSSVFILTNSVAGLVGQIIKNNINISAPEEIIPYIPLWLAVIIGGQIGSYLGVEFLNKALMQRITACLILVVGIRLIWQSSNLS